MKTATFISGNAGSIGPDQRLYRLSERLENHEYVIVSAQDWSSHKARKQPHPPETYIFGADAKGGIISYWDLTGSYVGSCNHEQALSNAGYTIIESTQNQEPTHAFPDQ